MVNYGEEYQRHGIVEDSEFTVKNEKHDTAQDGGFGEGSKAIVWTVVNLQ